MDLLRKEKIIPSLLTKNLYCAVAHKSGVSSEDVVQDFNNDIIHMKVVDQSGFAIRNRKWEHGEIYDNYDVYGETNPTYGGFTSPIYAKMYVINKYGQLYLCVDNNHNRESLFEPFGTHNEYIKTPDGYTWYYMLNVSQMEKNDEYVFVVDFPMGDFEYGLVSSVKIIDPGFNIENLNFTILGDGEELEIEPIISGNQLIRIDVANPGKMYSSINIVWSGLADIFPITKVIVQPHGGFRYNLKSILHPSHLFFKTVFDSRSLNYDLEYDRVGLLTPTNTEMYIDYTTKATLKKLSESSIKLKVGMDLTSEKDSSNHIRLLSYDEKTGEISCIIYGDIKENDVLSGLYTIHNIETRKFSQQHNDEYVYIEKKEVFKSFEYQRTVVWFVLQMVSNPSEIFDRATLPVDWQQEDLIERNEAGAWSYLSFRHGVNTIQRQMYGSTSNWIHLTIPWELKPIDETCTDPILTNLHIVPIRDDYGNCVPNDTSIFRYVRELKSSGYKVSVSPVLYSNFSDNVIGSNRLIAKPEDIREFFYKDDGYKAFIDHYVQLLKNLEPDAFFIGNNLHRLTTIRDGDNFPFVSMLRETASLTKATIPKTKISYSAGFWEYSGIQYEDGIFYPLDQLWSSQFIDFIGIDFSVDIRTENIQSYNSFKEWFFGFEYSKFRDQYGNVLFKKDDAPINNNKNFMSFWGNYHYDKNGVTGWVPRMKPIWLTDVYTSLVFDESTKTNKISVHSKFMKHFARFVSEYLNAIYSRQFMIEKIFSHDAHGSMLFRTPLWNFFRRQKYEETKNKICNSLYPNLKYPQHFDRYIMDCRILGNCCPMYNSVWQHNNQIPYGETCPMTHEEIRDLLCISCEDDEYGIMRCSKNVRFTRCCNSKSTLKLVTASKYFSMTSYDGVIEYYDGVATTRDEVPSKFKERFNPITTKYHYRYDGRFLADNTINYGEL